MALDATVGGASADTYATLVEYSAYADAMGLTLSGDTTSQEANLRRARAYLDRAYVWAGYLVSSTQALAWPRVIDYLVEGYSVPVDDIPQDIKDAQCEMAYLIQEGADPFATLTAGAVTGERKKVDVIETQTTYSDSTARSRPSYPAVDQLVGFYVTGKAGARSGSIGLVRA